MNHFVPCLSSWGDELWELQLHLIKVFISLCFAQHLELWFCHLSTVSYNKMISFLLNTRSFSVISRGFILVALRRFWLFWLFLVSFNFACLYKIKFKKNVHNHNHNNVWYHYFYTALLPYCPITFCIMLYRHESILFGKIIVSPVSLGLLTSNQVWSQHFWSWQHCSRCLCFLLRKQMTPSCQRDQELCRVKPWA